MQMANKIGFTLDEAELLRRIVGKKKRAEVKKWKKKIKDRVKEQNLDPDIGDILWKILEDSANYSFNKSHSISYAALSASTIYLKFKYPQQFFLSLLKMTRHEGDSISEISKIQKEMASFNITLLPPNIIKSKMDFSMEGEDIRFGLISIKGISDKSIQKLNDFKKDSSTKLEVFEAAKEAGLTVSILCALIHSGALQGFKQSRSKVAYEAQLWNVLTEREKRLCLGLAGQHRDDLVQIFKTLLSKTEVTQKGVVKPCVKESRHETIKKKSLPYKAIYDQNSKSESFANWYYEKHLLGYTYGKALKDIFIEKSPDLMGLGEVNEQRKGRKVTFIGTVVSKPALRTSKNGNRYLITEVDDETGRVKVMLFNDKVEMCEDENNGVLPEDKNIVVVVGQKQDDNTIFADRIIVQTNKIYTKYSDMKSAKKKSS